MLFPLFATGIKNTSGIGGKICCRCCYTGSKFAMTLMLFSGAWGKMIHEKNLKLTFSLMGVDPVGTSLFKMMQIPLNVLNKVSSNSLS
jgi:hypothetical protein